MAKQHSDKDKVSGDENLHPHLSQKPVELSSHEQDITDEQEKAVLEKATKRGLSVDYQQDKDKVALAVRDGSMADDPDFEAYAKEWEQRLGITAYKDENTEEVLSEAAQKVLAYVDNKAAVLGDADATLRETLSNEALTTLGSNVTGSGSVGKSVEKIRKALTEGSVSSQFAHVSAFINHVLKNDVLTLDVENFNSILQKSGINGDATAIKKSFFAANKSKDELAKSPVKVHGDAQNQGLNRTKRYGEGETHLEKGERSVSELRDSGINISQDEVDANLIDPKDSDKVQMVEGVRMWAMNERNKWVHAMREMSLPLAAGVSGTTARMTKGLEQIDVGTPETRRLACIGYIIPYHHHSLVEIMAGASGNGGPQFTPSKQMYRDIKPYEEDFLREKVGKFPDEVHPETK